MSEPVETERACETCRYWSKCRPYYGECRYNPPQPLNESNSAWPITERSKWCGRWVER